MESYYNRNKERLLIKDKALRNTPEYRVYRKEYWTVNKYKYAQKQNEYVKKHYRKSRNALMQMLGGKCSNIGCLVSGGCTDVRCLQFDHVNGGGTKEIRKMGWIRMVDFYLKNPEEAKANIQILCANCNWIKRFEKTEQPIMQKK